MEFVTENWPAIVVALLAVSEVLAQVQSVKSNSVFELIVNVLKAVQPKGEE